MKRNEITWFGFEISQKQSVQIFIVSIIGLIISIFFLLLQFITLINIFSIHQPSDPQYIPEYDEYVRSTIIINISPAMFFLTAFFTSLYSIIKCRKITQNYSNAINPVITTKQILRYTDVKTNSVAQYCSMCGYAQKGHEKFCSYCGTSITT